MNNFESLSSNDDNLPLLSMSKSNEDPFYLIRDEVKAQVESIKVRNEKFHSMLKDVDTSTNSDFKELRKGLVKDIRSADKKVKGLKDAVDVVESNRVKFAHIKNPELAARKSFVDEMQRILNDIKAGMESVAVRRKMENDENKSTAGSLDATGNPMLERERENDRFIREQRMVTKDVIRQQDAQLDTLGTAVDRLGKIGRDVNQELKEQNIMLDGLEHDLDDADQRMNVVMESLNKLLKTKDGCQIWTIVILTLILIILIALVIWV